MKLSFAIFIFTFSLPATATSWPNNASGLTSIQLQSIQMKFPQVSREALEQFDFVNYKPTIGPHGIVTYLMQSQETCSDGQSGPSNTFLVLYVENDQVRISTMFSHYFCHED